MDVFLADGCGIDLFDRESLRLERGELVGARIETSPIDRKRGLVRAKVRARCRRV